MIAVTPKTIDSRWQTEFPKKLDILKNDSSQCVNLNSGTNNTLPAYVVGQIKIEIIKIKAYLEDFRFDARIYIEDTISWTIDYIY